MDNKRIIHGYTICLLAALVTVGCAVRITNLKVPSVYVVNDIDGEASPELVLDCEYEVNNTHPGFVLKWLLNDQPIYQWIGDKLPQPHSVPVMKNRINLNYTVSANPKHKYRALAITRPTLNMTGTYTCSVGTYYSEDKRSAHMLMMHRESQLRVQMMDSRDRKTRKVECIASDVYPEPNLRMFLNDKEIDNFPKSSKLNDTDGLYDVVMFGNLERDAIDSPASVRCELSIPDTNYTSIAYGTSFSSSSRAVLSWLTVCGLLAIALYPAADPTA